MSIVGGLDIHRKQLTFDYLDTVTGQVTRGQVSPADREHLRAWLARFAGRDDVAFAFEGCTGWRDVAEEMAAAGTGAHLAERAGTAFARGRKRRAKTDKTDKTDSRHLRQLLAEGRLPECWVPPEQVLEARALLETYHDLRREHTAWVQRIHAVFFHQGAPALGEIMRTAVGLDAVRAAAAAGLSPAGQQQVAVALAVMTCLEDQLCALRHQLLDTARHLAGRRRPVLLRPQGGQVRRPGCHRLLQRRQAGPGPPVPVGPAGPALGGLRGRQDPRPRLGPRPRLLRAGEGPQEQQARRPVRGPQDHPPGLPHPQRPRRRRLRRRLNRPGDRSRGHAERGRASQPLLARWGTTAASSRRAAVSRRPARKDRTDGLLD
jgi:hypothetical protein